jgi:hypothetical protein
MQFEITDEAATAFASGFYGALAADPPIDDALAQARKAIHAASRGVEWGAPVLYLGSRDGVVFEMEPAGDTYTIKVGARSFLFRTQLRRAMDPVFKE